MAAKSFISPHAQINLESVTIKAPVTIHDDAIVCDDSVLEKYAVIGSEAVVGEGSYIGWGARIGAEVRVGRLVLILPKAVLCRDAVVKHSTNARQIGHRATIGEGVVLHNEVELGTGAIIPTQQTVASIGSFGEKNRTLTIYGSDVGPRYSVGCQIGIDFTTLQDRVGRKACSTASSSGTYVPFMDAFDEIGMAVQGEYEKQRPLVDELKAMRAEKFAHLNLTDERYLGF